VVVDSVRLRRPLRVLINAFVRIRKRNVSKKRKLSVSYKILIRRIRPKVSLPVKANVYSISYMDIKMHQNRIRLLVAY
jgi:hypothetical protein